MARWLRRIPIEAVVVVGIIAFMLATRIRYIRNGMCFDDPSWYFHFGRRVVEGDVPYRDFIFQVGPLPIYVEAAFQRVFGSVYAASLYAGMAVTMVRVYVTWVLVRRIAGVRAASVLLVYCALDPSFAAQSHHWSTPYAQLFFTLAGYAFVCAVQAASERRTSLYLGLAGAMMALVVSGRQSAALMIAVVAFVLTAILLVRKEFFTPRRFAALWGGYAIGALIFAGLLATQGALGDAVQQMFLDAPAKKGVHGASAVLDALSGGALVAPGFSWWTGFLTFLGVPFAIVAGITWLGSREAPLAPGAVALAVLPVALLVGMGSRYAVLSYFTDLPRTFLCVVVAFAVLSPHRLRQWFGLEPVIAIGLGALPMAADFALEMSFPGRGWGDMPSLVCGAIAVSLASTRLPQRAKVAICAGFSIMGLVHFAVYLKVRVNPFAQVDAVDGTLRENKFRVAHPMLEGMRLTRSRRAGLTWLTSQVRPGSTCFMYGNMPVLYDLLGCTNPTRIDSTAGDFITAADAEAAIAVLRAQPPDYLIAQEKAWMNPPLQEARAPGVEGYSDSLNPAASYAIHAGLRSLLDRYESVGLTGDGIGEELARLADLQRDKLNAVRVYRRVR